MIRDNNGRDNGEPQRSSSSSRTSARTLPRGSRLDPQAAPIHPVVQVHVAVADRMTSVPPPTRASLVTVEAIDSLAPTG